MTTVVAGVMERGGRVLIVQRRSSDAHPLKWEFPGGKVEPGESPEAALIRELREELAVEARVDRELLRYEYQYARRPAILLIFFRVVEFDGEPQNLQFEQILWEQPTRLPDYDFLEGDAEFIRLFAA